MRLIRILTLLISCRVLSASPGVLPQTDNTSLPNEMRARAILTEGLESNDFAVRIQAIAAVSMVGSNDAIVARLEGFLRDRNVEVRVAAIRAMADLKSARIKDGLRQTLQQDNAPEVSFA